ncbi:MAG: CAP domain-containing protein [Elainellaceae cyanobacterium]
MTDAHQSLNPSQLVPLARQNQDVRSVLRPNASHDLYRFRLPKTRFRASLGGLQANADLELIRDRNRNGSIDPGEVVASSRATGRQVDRITIVGLEPGAYYLRVVPDGQRTRYRLLLSAQATNRTSKQYQVVQKTNAYRMQQGQLPLAVNTQLSRAAQQYARHMAVNDVFSHQGADGSSPWDRIRAADYDYSEAAENLAGGYSTAAGALQGWISSPGHRANLLAYQVQEIGVGYIYQRNDPGNYTFQHYWSQSFGTPASVSVNPSIPSSRYPER